MAPEQYDTDRIAEFDSLPMRVGAGQFMVPTEQRLRFVKQLGVEDILLNFYAYDQEYTQLPNEEYAPLEGEREWSYENLIDLRDRVENAGLRLNAIENLPTSFYDDVMLGREGRDKQLSHVKNTIRNMGRAGIPVLGYHWMPSGVWRTGSVSVRGGAEATAFDAAEVDDDPTHEREYSEAELWDNYKYFLREVLPVAEEAGVTLCVHPNDPPVEELGGVPQLFRNFQNYQHAMELVPSDNHGLEFCLGCWSEMGADLEEVIRHFGGEKIVYVHFRDVEGTVPNFHETFVDEGNFDTYAIMELLRDVGFSGMLISDHVPHVEGDTEWGHRGRAYTIGYLKSTLDAVKRE